MNPYIMAVLATALLNKKQDALRSRYETVIIDEAPQVPLTRQQRRALERREAKKKKV